MIGYRIIGYTNNRRSEVGIVVLLPAISLLLSRHKKRAQSRLFNDVTKRLDRHDSIFA